MDPKKIEIDKLSTAKRKLLSRLLQEKLGKQPVQTIPAQEEKEYYPLSYNQEQLWFLDTLEKGSPFYNVPIAMRFKNEIDVKTMQAALNEVVRRHHVLQTCYLEIEGKPYQKIVPGFTPGIDSRDLQGEKDPETRALEMLIEEAKTPFTPGTPPLKALLFRLAADDYIFMIKLHHIVIDGWSLPIFNNEFLHVYRTMEEKKEWELPALSIQYKDFAHWQRRKISEGGFESQLEYWRKQLAGPIEPLDLPTDFPRPKEQTFRGKRQTGTFPPALVQQLKNIIKGTENTLFMVVVAGYSILLSRYTGKKDILMGTQMSNRLMPGQAPLIGYFSNSVVLRFRVQGQPTFKDYLEQVKEVVRQTQDNQEFPFEKLVQELRVPRTLGQNPLFQVMLVYRAQTPTGNETQRFKTTGITIDNDTSKFDLDLLITENQDQIDISIIYNSDIFTPTRIERMLAHFENILSSIARDPGQRISRIDFLTAQEKEKLLTAWNNTGTEFPGDRCLHGLFEEQAAKDPEAPCIYYRDQRITRRELEDNANRLARYLRKHGLKPNRLAAICIEKSIEMVTGLLGILKAGGGYLPLDPTYPPSRIEYMLTQSGAVMILTQDHLRGILPHTETPITCLDSDWEKIALETNEPCPPVNTPADIVYGIFTSGSTGNPKMTVLDHRGRVNNFTDFNRRFKIGKEDRILAVSSLGFDMCAYDILGSQAGGSAIVLPEPDFELQPAHWAELMVRHDVTIWHSVPSKLELLTAYIAANPAYIPGKCRLVLLGGDWIPLHQPDRYREFVPNAVIVSLGGATEVSMDSTIYIVEKVDPTWKSIPYGKPMANQLTYIIDDDINLVPEGIPGELCIGGVGVGWGYWGNPGLTAEKFIPNPWSRVPGDRMYRTGDLARYKAGGVLELLGRVDFQVKIRGYRIELGEIEAALNHHELIDKALVMAKKDPANHGTTPKIIAYVIPQKDANVKETAQNLTPENLRLYLKDRLPEYFIPAGFVFLERYPLTPNGKIDRRALQELDPGEGEETREKKSNAPYTPPAAKIEKLLAAAWKSLLEVEDISIHDNFFTLGGDSVKCIQLVARAREAGIDITLKQIFRNQTIAEMARVIEETENMNPGETVPLTPHQYLLIKEMNTYKHPLVDGIWLEIPAPLDPAWCKGALEIITREYDCFKLRYQAGETGWRQSYDGKRTNMLVYTHVEIGGPADADREKYEHEIITRTQRNIEKALDLLDGPVLGAALVTFEPSERTPLLYLAVPRLILSGISRYMLEKDLDRLMRGYAEGNPPLSLGRGSFVKWAGENRQELFPGLDPVEPYPLEEAQAEPAWQSAYFSLEPGWNGINKILQTQPVISLAEMILAALCTAWAQENPTAPGINMKVLLSTWRKGGKLPPPGGHGEFFTIRVEPGEVAELSESVKWVHRLEAMKSFSGVQGAVFQKSPLAAGGIKSTVQDEPRKENGTSSVSVYIIEPPPSYYLPAGALKIKPLREHPDLRQSPPVGTESLQLRLWPGDEGIRLEAIYDGKVWETAAVGRYYRRIREMLQRVPGIYSLEKPSIYTAADFPGTGITREEISRLLRENPGIVDIYGLGPMQRYVLQNWQQYTGKGLYVIQYAFYLSGDLDIAALEKSWQELVRRYDILRTVFSWRGLKEPVQVVMETLELSIQKEDWREKSGTQQEKDLEEFFQTQRAAGFDLEKGPLIRLFLLRMSDDRYLFIQFNSYIILDGWSVLLLRKELLAIYRAKAGQTGPYEIETYPYRHYVDWVNRQDLGKAREFWKQALQGLGTPTLLHREKRNQDLLSNESKIEHGNEIQTAVMETDLGREMQRKSQENRVTLNSLVMGAWYLVLRDRLKRGDLVFGVTSSGRPPALENVESLVGLLVNTLPLRVHWDTDGAFIEGGREIGEFLNRAAAYEYITLEEIEQSLDRPGLSGHLFDTVLVFDNYPVDKSLLEMGTREEGEAGMPWEKLNFSQFEIPLRIAVRTINLDRMSLVFSYHRDKFAPQTIAELIQLLGEKLAAIAGTPGRSIRDS